MTNRRLNLHYLGLAGAIALGTILRCWHLGLKPLWMDEVITAIFSLGKNYDDLPLNVLFPLNHLHEIFTFQPGVSCNQIAENVATQSTHPPLFFCGMHIWLGWMLPLGEEWVEKLRSLPTLLGVCAIAAIYGVNRISFSKASGTLAAAIMAVSPFAVYLSQEARHYTMPMLLITLALLGLMQIQRDIFEQESEGLASRTRLRFWVWLLWAIINIIGLYVHYFFALAFIAEIFTLLVVIYLLRANIQIKRQILLALIVFTSSVVISFTPWLLVISNHVQRSETNWLPSPNYIAPLYQTLISWVLMVIALPVENQPLPIAVIYGLSMVSFATLLGWHVFNGLKLLWLKDTTYLATLTLLSFTFFVLVQFFFIVYFLKKDITIVPRYSFVYYPSFCALLAASLGNIQNYHSHSVLNRKSSDRQKPPLQLSSKYILLVVGIISCIFVVSNLVFQKPFQPNIVAQKMNLEPSVPLMLVVKYSNYQDVALGLSFGLALEKLRSQSLSREFKIDQSNRMNSLINSDSVVFLQQSSNLTTIWNKLSQLPSLGLSRLNLWIVASGLKRRDYPQHLQLSQQTTCNIDTNQYYRIGVPYQLYRCSKFGS
ncbi:hypothetical protein WKK05_00180 [Nostoc sp. UHCC 0302]|uniref:glycosyltransferase family 39 protein n=1 Tax=Nostoc sp. UHCC 0302 TaxID=3134896 RepID=UPI00311CB7EE